MNMTLNSTPQHVERIKPQFSVDISGKITWLPGLIDYDASAFYRGKTVTNEEFNQLFLRDVYQGNYITDSLTELFEKHLGTAIYRSFTTDFKLVPSYVKSFGTTDWGNLQEDGYYYITITAEEHGFKPAEEELDLDKMNIDTEMYLLGSDGRFYEVPQVDTESDNTVRLYTDDNTLSGFVVIRTNDKAYALATEEIEASQVKGLANVATSAKYTDLIDIDAANGPNTKIRGLTKDILDIINGDTEVAEALHATNADNATRLLSGGYIQGIKVSDIFETGSRYVKDATKAKNYDENSGTIKTRFDSIENNVITNINTINNTIKQVKNDYYKKTDTVTNAQHAQNAINANHADHATSADIANNIKTPIEYKNITVSATAYVLHSTLSGGYTELSQGTITLTGEGISFGNIFMGSLSGNFTITNYSTRDPVGIRIQLQNVEQLGLSICSFNGLNACSTTGIISTSRFTHDRGTVISFAFPYIRLKL